MKLSIISSSLRIDSQSKRVAGILNNRIKKINKKCDTFTIDLINENCPFWSNKKDSRCRKNNKKRITS